MKSLNVVSVQFVRCVISFSNKQNFNTHISAYEVRVVVNHSPWCDPNCISLPQVVAPKCFHCLTYMLRHT